MKKILMVVSILFTIIISPTILAMESNNPTPTVIILLGAPASGKGTLSARISKELHIPHISTGDLFRENLKNMTPVGQEAKTYMDEGKLVPDKIVLEMLSQRIALSDATSGYILDGFPRTLIQAKELDNMLKDKANIYVVNLDISDDVLIKRITERAKASDTKRSDDTPEIAKKRLKIYHQESKPLVDYYKNKGQLIITVTEKSPDEVFKEVMDAYHLKQQGSLSNP